MAISRGWVSVSQPETSSTFTCLSSKIQKSSTGHTASRSRPIGMIPTETDGSDATVIRWPSWPAITSAPPITFRRTDSSISTRNR